MHSTNIIVIFTFHPCVSGQFTFPWPVSIALHAFFHVNVQVSTVVTPKQRNLVFLQFFLGDMHLYVIIMSFSVNTVSYKKNQLVSLTWRRCEIIGGHFFSSFFAVKKCCWLRRVERQGTRVFTSKTCFFVLFFPLKRKRKNGRRLVSNSETFVAFGVIHSP